jgi:hypothetical protein
MNSKRSYVTEMGNSAGAGEGKVVVMLNQARRHEEVLGSDGITPCSLSRGKRWR